MKLPETRPEELEIMDQLRAYTALDHPVRLRAFTLIHGVPGRSFNEIAKELGVETGLAAYHIGVLKAAGLIEMTYIRNGRETSAYRLTSRGERLHSTLLRADRSHPRKTASARSRATAAR